MVRAYLRKVTGLSQARTTRRILQRAWEQFGDRRYERLAKISVAHWYNLRASAR